MKKAGTYTMTEHLRRSVSVYDIHIAVREDGDEIFLRKKDGTEHRIMIV